MKGVCERLPFQVYGIFQICTKLIAAPGLQKVHIFDGVETIAIAGKEQQRIKGHFIDFNISTKVLSWPHGNLKHAAKQRLGETRLKSTYIMFVQLYRFVTWWCAVALSCKQKIVGRGTALDCGIAYLTAYMLKRCAILFFINKLRA